MGLPLRREGEFILCHVTLIIFTQDKNKPKSRRADIRTFNLLNAELNPICHLLALLGAHHILHVSRIRVKVEDA